MITAVYPGTFDPATNGHLDIAVRAAAIFDQLIVAVYDTPAKTLLFSTEEREEMLREALKELPNVTVTRFSGLTVEFAKKVGAKVVVRGLRALSDFELELQMALLNRSMEPDIEVVCLMTSPENTFLSSSMVKEIGKLGGEIEHMVPKHITEALRSKFRPCDKSNTVPRFLDT